MKTKDRDLAKRGADNARHKQEDAASRDFERQRRAGADEYAAKAKKQKRKQSGK